MMTERLSVQIKANPHDTEALTARGILYGQLGDHRRVVEGNGRIIDLEPRNVESLHNRALLYRELGDL